MEQEKIQAEYELGPVVVCSDLDQFCDHVVEMRKVPDEASCLYKFVVDEGQGHTKISLSVIKRNKQMDPVTRKKFDDLKDTGVK